MTARYGAELKNSLYRFVPQLLVAGLLIPASGDLFAKGGKAMRRIDVTPPSDTNDVVSLQAEDNYYDINANYINSQTHYLNATLEYATKAGYTYQIQVINYPMSGGGAQNYEKDWYFGVSKYTKLNSFFAVNTGSANGTVFGAPAMQWHSSHYINLDYKVTDWFTIYGGGYYANKQLSTTTGVFGYLTGFSIKLLQDYKIEGQYLSGQNNLSGGTLNLWYKNVYLGIGAGEANSGNNWFGTAGFKINLFNF